MATDVMANGGEEVVGERDAVGGSAEQAETPQRSGKQQLQRFYLVRVPRPFADADAEKEVATMDAKCEALRQRVKLTGEVVRFKRLQKSNARSTSLSLSLYTHTLSEGGRRAALKRRRRRRRESSRMAKGTHAAMRCR